MLILAYCRLPVTIDQGIVQLTTQFSFSIQSYQLPKCLPKLAPRAALLDLAVQPELVYTGQGKKGDKRTVRVMLPLARDPFLRPGFKTSAHPRHVSTISASLLPELNRSIEVALPEDFRSAP